MANAERKLNDEELMSEYIKRHQPRETHEIVKKRKKKETKTEKVTIKQTNKQTNQPTNKQTNKQIEKETKNKVLIGTLAQA